MNLAVAPRVLAVRSCLVPRMPGPRCNPSRAEAYCLRLPPLPRSRAVLAAPAAGLPLLVVCRLGQQHAVYLYVCISQHCEAIRVSRAVARWHCMLDTGSKGERSGPEGQRGSPTLLARIGHKARIGTIYGMFVQSSAVAGLAVAEESNEDLLPLAAMKAVEQSRDSGCWFGADCDDGSSRHISRLGTCA